MRNYLISMFDQINEEESHLLETQTVATNEEGLTEILARLAEAFQARIAGTLVIRTQAV